jgi:hypothetical protein
MSRGGSGATKTDLRLYAILVVGLACWLLQLLAPPTLFGTFLSPPRLKASIRRISYPSRPPIFSIRLRSGILKT